MKSLDEYRTFAVRGADRKEMPHCVSDIPVAATRGPHCTSTIEDNAPNAPADE